MFVCLFIYLFIYLFPANGAHSLWTEPKPTPRPARPVPTMSTGQSTATVSTTKEDIVRSGVLDGSLSEIGAGVETLKRLQRETFQELMSLRQQFSQLERWRGKRPEDFTTRTTIRGSMECGASFVPTLRSEALKGMKLVVEFDVQRKVGMC